MSPETAPLPDIEPPMWLTPLLARLDRLLVVLEPLPDTTSSGEWMSAAELAGLLGVCERSIRTWEFTGKLPRPVKVGRLKKWNRREVQTHLSKTR